MIPGLDGDRIEGGASGLERRQIQLSAAIILIGAGLWALHRILSIPVPRWGSIVGGTAADLIGDLNLLYSMILAPLLSLVLIGFSVWLIVVAVRRFRGKVILVLLPVIALLFPVAFLLYQVLGLVLLATMDF